MPPRDNKDEEKEEPFDVQFDEGGWMRCCPQFVGLGTMTCIMAILGFVFGVILYETDAPNNWMECYQSPAGSVSQSYTADTIDGVYVKTWNDATHAQADSANAFSGAVTAGKKTYKEPARKSCWLVIVKWPGQMWKNLLSLMVIPLMATMVLTLPEKLGSIAPVGMRLLALLIFTSFCAALQGLFWGNIFKPGEGVNTALKTARSPQPNYISEFESVMNVLTLFFPSNIFDQLVNSKIIGIIVFFLVYGIHINRGPQQWARPVIDGSKAILRATLRILIVVMWFTPIAMFSLIAYSIADMDDLWKVFEALGKYVGCQLLGQAVHLCVFYFGFFFLATRSNPIAYFMKIKEAPLTALITSSSAATMPVTIKVNRENAKNDSRLVQFTIPLGAGMNMDGTSLGFPIMVLFTAQLSGINLSFSTQLTVAILSMVCSLGTAPIPNAGLVFLQMLYMAADIPEESQGMGMALIYSVDWLIDRVETAQNVTSDSFVCGVLNHYFTGNGGCLSCCMAGIVDEDAINDAVTPDTTTVQNEERNDML